VNIDIAVGTFAVMAMDFTAIKFSEISSKNSWIWTAALVDSVRVCVQAHNAHRSQISLGIAHPLSRLCLSDLRHTVPCKFWALKISYSLPQYNVPGEQRTFTSK
jgi:hypothetical protein